MSKNRNGMGSIRQRADGRFEARYTGADGKQHSLFAKTATEASRRLREATAAVDSGDWLQPNRITVGEWLDTWLKDYCTHVRPSSLRIYETRAGHIKESIGHIKLAALTPAHIRRVLADMQRKSLASNTITAIRAVMAAAFNCAVEAHIIKENPAAGIKPPKFQPVREMHIIDRPQIPAFLAAARKTQYGNVLIFMLLTGLRVGECLGLTWSCVNLDAGEITISRQLIRSRNAYLLAPTKTGETRKLLLVQEAVAILRAQKTTLAEQHIAAGHMWQSSPLYDDLVFRMPNGRNMIFQTIMAHTHTIGDEIGIQGLHPHDLRHSYAVAALRSGADVKTVQHNLGHSSAAMTLDIYAKYTEDAGATAARLLSAYFSDSLSY